MSDSEDCLFCSIVKGDIPSTKVFEDDRVFAFEDIAPKAKVHVLIVPKRHVASVAELADCDAATLAHIVDVAKDIAEERYNGSFRLVFNTGRDAGQTVFHAHAHVLTGEVLDE